MKKTLKQKTLMAIFPLLAYAFVLSIAVGSASSQAYAYSPSMILTGKFISKWQKGDFHTFQFIIRGQKKLFNITKITKLTPGDAQGWDELEQVFPSILILTGDEKGLSLLATENIMDKTFDIQGTLYFVDGVLFVNSIKDISK